MKFIQFYFYEFIQCHFVVCVQDYTQVPSWLNVNRPLVPDFVAKNPKVIEIFLDYFNN